MREFEVVGKSLVMRTRAAKEGRPYTGSDVGAGLRARPISPNNRLFRQPPEGHPSSHSQRFLEDDPASCFSRPVYVFRETPESPRYRHGSV